MKPMTQDTATPRPSQSPTDPLDPRRSSRTSRRQSPKVIVRRQMNLTMRDRCQPIVTMTPTSSCSCLHGTVRPSWRDPHHFRQSHADRPCVLEELSLQKALKEEVEEESLPDGKIAQFSWTSSLYYYHSYWSMNRTEAGQFGKDHQFMIHIKKV